MARLLPAVPNPFAAHAGVRFSLPVAGSVRVDVLDAAGRMVRRLHDAPLAAGAHRLAWDGRTDDGTRAAPGVYLCRLSFGGDTRVQRLTRLR